jgi:exopolysaccharide biosynthesis polyprenyl glycosylphosphotransferase
VETFLGEASLALGHPGPTDTALVAKRVIDITLASLALIFLAPIFLFIAALIRLSSPGPVFFRQTRIGLQGRKFTIYKFRTMVRDADALLPAYAKRNLMGDAPFKDPQDFRVTPLGRWLRRASLDELPQLFNVLRGSMSLVGPRPLPVHEATSIGREFRRRFSMKPGITCLWQVNGRSTVPFRQWMQYDVQYVDHWSIWLDAQLLVKTIPAVFSGKGAC